MVECFDGGQKSSRASNWFRQRIRFDIVNIVVVYNRQLGHNQLNLLTNEKTKFQRKILLNDARRFSSENNFLKINHQLKSTPLRIDYGQMIQQRVECEAA